MTSAEPERIRFCLACGEVMPFALRACPACGRIEEPAGDLVPEAVEPCRSCGKDVDAARLFCPHCGVERRQGPVLVMPPDAPPPGSAGRLPLLVAVLTLLGPLALLAAVLAAYSAP